MNANPRIRAANRSLFLFNKNLIWPEYEYNNSEVASTIIAVIAIQRLISDMERGNCTCLTFYDLIEYINSA